jgi:hypothetical protein
MSKASATAAAERAINEYDLAATVQPYAERGCWRARPKA